jgi:hypothetical protein
MTDEGFQEMTEASGHDSPGVMDRGSHSLDTSLRSAMRVTRTPPVIRVKTAR